MFGRVFNRSVCCEQVDLLKIGHRYSLSSTCRFGGGRTLGKVHEIVCDVEKHLYDGLKEFRRVTIHAEPAWPFSDGR